MKKFVFSLQSLMNVKLTTEKQQKSELQQWEAKIADLLGEFNQTKTIFLASKESYIRESVRGMQVEQIHQYSHYFSYLNDTMASQRKQIAVCEEKRRKCVEQLVETRREIKSLEKLQEKQYTEYLQEVKIEEEKAIADLVSYQIIKSS